LRNQSDIVFSFGSTELEKNDYEQYDLVLTIGPDNEEEELRYSWYKETLQNKLGLPHQHVTLENAEENSVMQIILQICLKLGGEPWLLPENKQIRCVVGVNTYFNPATETRHTFVVVFDGQGRLLKQYEPIMENQTDKLLNLLLDIAKEYHRVLYLMTFDRFGIFDQIEKKLGETTNEYCIAQIIDNSSFRFFETYAPKKAPKFGNAARQATICPIEAYESAPQGRILKCAENCFYLLTGKTIEKDALKRGCPTPIELTIVAAKGDWNMEQLANYVLSLCMMGRASGHMTRFPMPLYYLQLAGHYVNKFGYPEKTSIQQKVFYV
jgi:hypothetical protein